jgi:Type II restriction enzyme MunI
MSSDANRLRRKWQDYSGKNAGIAESNFYETFRVLFEDTEFRVRAKPDEFSTIYVGIKLSKQELSEIYTPAEPITKHGVVPDYAIDNTETNKTIYVEVKRQDGWVEGGVRADGRGNAHERSCKFFTPGLQKILRQKGNLGDNILPFWTVFQGDITRDPCRVREINCWFDGLTTHYFFWRNSNNSAPLIEHFIEKIKPLLS